MEVALVVLFFWFVWSVINGEIAIAKGRSQGWSICLSIALSPFMIYAYLLAVPPLPKK